VSPTLIIAVVLVVLGSMGILVVGAIYKWDLAAPGYALWTRVIGVVTVAGLTAVTAWSRRDEPLLVIAIIAGGVALAVGFVVLHKRLSDRVREALQEPPAT